MKHEEGFALVAAMATALLCSIAAFAVLFMATSQARLGWLYQGRAEARYLAEAGLVIATQKLMADPNYCPGGVCTRDPADPINGSGINCEGPERVDTNGDGDTLDPEDAVVAVTVTNCGMGNAHVIGGKVLY